MMNLKRKLTSLVLLVVILGVKTQTASDSLNSFAVNLLTTISIHPDAPKNLAISPYTVWTLLSIIDEGARGNTARELENVLGIPSQNNKNQFRNDFNNMSNILSRKDKDLNLDIHNSIFTTAEHKLNPTFKNISEKSYGVNIQPVDFNQTKQAADLINRYVSQATRNRINDFLKPNDLENASIFLVSTMYFRGAWTMPFNKSLTYRDTFYDEKHNKLGEVDMMYHMGFFPYSRLDEIKGYAVELPYGKGDQMSMIVILPYRDETLKNMLLKMKKYDFSVIIQMLEKAKEEFEDEDVKVYLPRFKIESDLSLIRVLTEMGIIEVFDQLKADLLGMFPDYLHISNLIQKSEIEVTEEGTVASSASGATLANKSPPPKFLANKPFLYFIVNKPTKSIIFAGQVTSPP